MGPAPKPDNENARIQKLHSLNILDSQYELVFDDLTQLASQICSTPISLISLTDSHRQWLKSKKGLEAREFDRDLGFCSYAIMGHELFEIPDARVDDRFKNNPYVLNSPHVVFYAGAPLVTSDGFVLGTLCVIDQIPKKLTETQKSNLQSLSRITSQLIEARNLINKQAEVNVLAERLEMALERANLGIWDWDIGTDRMEYDHRWCSMLGIDPATVKMEPITWKERIHPDDVALCDTTLDRYLKGETTFYECTYRLKHTDGSWRHILSRGSFSGFDHTGKAVRFTGMNFDITAVVEARLQLAERERQLNEAQITANIGSWSFDIKTQEISWSDQMYRIFSRDREKGPHTYEEHFDCIEPEDRKHWLKVVETCADDGKPYKMRFRTNSPNGTVWLEACGRGERNLKGEIVRLLGTCQDITQQVKIETELQKASAAKSQFFANMSHELRTPLNAILGYCDLLLEEFKESPGSLTLDLNKIRDAGYHLLQLISQILDLSKIEAGKMELQLGEMNLHELALEIQSVVTPLVLKNSNQLIVELPELIPMVISDRSKIKQIAINLLSNSAKFTHDGKIQLLMEIDRTKSILSMTFSDTGIGIPNDRLQNIFQEFTQIDNPSTRHVDGTGLGLSICKQFVDMLGGTIKVQSVLRKGSTFQVYIPISIDPPKEVSCHTS